MSAQHTPGASIISWDINERALTDGSPTFDVVGTSDEGRVTFYCTDERAAEAVCETLNSNLIVGAVAETLHQQGAKGTQAPSFALPPLDDELREILGRPNFRCMQIASVLRAAGQQIACKSEDEQAAVLYWMLGKYAAHGPDWWQHAREELAAMAAAAQAGSSNGSSA